MQELKLYNGDSLEVLKNIPENSVDSICCDPPYGLAQEPDALEMLKDWIEKGHHDVKAKGGFMGECFHPETDILTKTGWKKIQDVLNTDLIASLNPENNEIQFVKVLKTHEYDFNGDMFLIGGRTALQLVTPNHNVMAGKSKDKKIFYSLVRADSLHSKFLLSNQGNYINPNNDTKIEFAGRLWEQEVLGEFLGIWLGDGYICHRINQPQKQDFIGISVKKNRKIDMIRKMLPKTGLFFTETPGKDKIDFLIYDKNLLLSLFSVRGAKNKNIPENLLLRLNRDGLDALYRGLINTDGTTQGENGQNVFFTSSNKLADTFQYLCFLTGRSATKKVKNYIVKGEIQTTYVMSVIQKNKKGFWMDKSGRSKNGRKQPSNYNKVPYAGKVYCITLEKNHILMSRFHGKMVWSGNSWDSFVPQPNLWKECFRVLKPGGHLVAFAGTRTMDLMTLGVRIAGFEIRDSIGYAHEESNGAGLLAWVYATGFPKGINIEKAINKMEKVEFEEAPASGVGFMNPEGEGGYNVTQHQLIQKGESTENAKKWEGWNTTLKPAWEPIVLARKPMGEKTVALNVLKYGTGAINIGACKIGDEVRYNSTAGNKSGTVYSLGICNRNKNSPPNKSIGRWPGNIVHDGSEDVVSQFPITKAGKYSEPDENTNGKFKGSKGWGNIGINHKGRQYGDEGSAARFFYCPKASNKDREEGMEDAEGVVMGVGALRDGDRLGYDLIEDCPVETKFQILNFLGTTIEKISKKQYESLSDELKEFFQKEEAVTKKNFHNTVKPTNLMRWLCKLVTPPNGTVLDPFMGSGSTGKAAILEGFSFIGIEREFPYFKISEKRINAVMPKVEETVKEIPIVKTEQMTLGI